MIAITNSAALASIVLAAMVAGPPAAKNLHKYKLLIPVGEGASTHFAPKFSLSPDGSRIVMFGRSYGNLLQINDRKYEDTFTYMNTSFVHSRDGRNFAMFCSRESWGLFRELSWRTRQTVWDLGGGHCKRAACSCLLGGQLNLYNYYHSGDGHRSAGLEIPKEKLNLYLLTRDGRTGPLPAGEVGRFAFKISSDGKSFACRYLQNNKHYLTANGKRYGPYENIENFVLSRDGTRLLASCVKGNGLFVRLNEKEHGPFDTISWLYESGGCIAKMGERYYVFIESGTYGPFAGVYSYASDTAGTVAFFFTAGRETPSGYRFNGEPLSDSFCYMQLSGSIVAKFQPQEWKSIQVFLDDRGAMSDSRSGYLSNGTFVRYAGPYLYRYRRGLATIDGREVAGFRPIDAHSFSLMYNGRATGVIRGELERIAISSDGKRIFVLARHDSGKYLHANNERYGPISDNLSHSWFISPGGKYYGYRTEDRCLYLNGKKFGPFQYGINMPLFTPDDGKYVIKYFVEHNAFIRVNDAVYGPYDYNYCDVVATAEGRIMVAYIKEGDIRIDELF
ncbi:MAG TPA: hypothetical protein PKM65_03220 [Spirochaetota bacterium]|nr:hypothetical protein [Spirochaetota bacterium]HNT10906.1 hypothetical protein [Spirochaetota bacterium]